MVGDRVGVGVCSTRGWWGKGGRKEVGCVFTAAERSLREDTSMSVMARGKAIIDIAHWRESSNAHHQYARGSLNCKRACESARNK